MSDAMALAGYSNMMMMMLLLLLYNDVLTSIEALNCFELMDKFSLLLL